MLSKSLLLSILAFLFTWHQALAQVDSKVPLNHTVYDSWTEIKNPKIANNGQFILSEKQAFRGDGSLLLYNVNDKLLKEWPRGYQAAFAYNNAFLAYKVKPYADTLRKQKLLKKKEDQLPKDSLKIYVFRNDTTLSYGPIKSYKMPEQGQTIALLYDKETQSNKSGKDTTKSLSKPKKGKKKNNGNRLQIVNPVTRASKEFMQVTDYEFSTKNDICILARSLSDSIDSCSVAIYGGITGTTTEVFKEPGYVQKLAIANQGDQLAFLYSPDTAKTKIYTLYYWKPTLRTAQKLIDSTTAGLPEDYIVSEHFLPWFSDEGDKLFLGTCPKPFDEPKDTLLPEEKAKVDIWSWNDPIIMTEQLSKLDKDKKKSYLAVYQINEKKFSQLASPELPTININKKLQTQLLLASTDLPYGVLKTWDDTYNDYYLIDIKQGKTQKLLTKCQSDVRLSLTGKYLVYWDVETKNWMCYQTKTQKTANLTQSIPYSFFDEEHDSPSPPSTYGLIGFSKDDKSLYINDRYDIWSIDLEGERAPFRITGNYGRKNKLRLSYRNLYPDFQYVDFNINNILSGFNEVTKQDAYFKINLHSADTLQVLYSGPFKLSNLIKAKDADCYTFMKQSFTLNPEIYHTNQTFANIEQVTRTNTQATKYLWGTVDLVNWLSPSGKVLDGLLYKPEGFEPTKKYPMIVYFYEKNSDNLYSYYSPRPSRSVINIPYFVSNGYLVFVPDISYTIGKPGKSAFDCIVSGTLSVCEKGFVDRERIGLQGQSWGGYQVAYLITQTNLFACAMAGAPVANMTSAYGGIRWESGMSRMFQYERTQSRIGKNLWEAPFDYLENSSVFYADQISTPFLMMANDNDGAVPWYQGIELYSAMRRLGKPAWLLNYNGDEHNLKAENYGNRMDLTQRMAQFFDHYLKGAPQPNWMKNGVPAINKGYGSNTN